MPLYDIRCRACGTVAEDQYLTKFTSPNPPCACGGTTERLVSRFGIVFTGPLTAKYNDRTLEGANREGHWATRLRTPDGVPQTVRIETFQDQKEFCKAEGLINPKDLPTNAEATSDRKLSGAGMPGAWI